MAKPLRSKRLEIESAETIGQCLKKHTRNWQRKRKVDVAASMRP